MRLKELKLENFRGFRALALDFDPRLTILVGRNGSGKTSVLDAIGAVFSKQVRLTDVHVSSDHFRIHLITPHGVFETSGYQTTHPPIESPPEFLVYYRVGRDARDQTPGSIDARQWGHRDALSSWHDASLSYSDLFTWWHATEVLERANAFFGEPAQSPQLLAARTAVHRFFDGRYKSPGVRQGFALIRMPVFTVEKANLELPFDSLSDGERNSVALIADIARRLALFGPSAQPAEDPLAHDGVVLIDEIEQHLHPGWQRLFVRRLPEVFPNLQFIVTTQSPVVVSEVSAQNLRVLDDFKLVDPDHHRGRDVNSVLEETFQTPARPVEIEQQLSRLADQLDERELDAAKELLGTLEQTLGQTDPDVVYYRNIYERLRSPG